MLKKLAQRLAFGDKAWDPVAYWRARADDPSTMSVMWANFAYNDLVDRDEWNVIDRYLPEHCGAVLDLGCGTGRMSARLAARCDRYVGVDLDTMVAEAARRHPHLASNFVAATVQDFDYPRDAFDFVLSLGVLATACTRATLDDVARRIVLSLKPGGRLLLIEPFHRHPLLTRGCKATTDEVAALFAGLGARVEDTSAMLFFPARMLLGEAAMGRLPRATRAIFEAGEQIVKLRPQLFGDYGIIVVRRG